MRLQFVFGSRSASVYPATGASNWIAEGQVGRGRRWGFEESEEKEGGQLLRRGAMGYKGCSGSPGKWAAC